MVDLDALRERMHDHDVINDTAVVILTAREVYDLLADIEALVGAKARADRIEAAARAVMDDRWEGPPGGSETAIALRRALDDEG